MKAEFAFNIGRFVFAIALGAGIADSEEAAEEAKSDPGFKMGFNAQ